MGKLLELPQQSYATTSKRYLVLLEKARTSEYFFNSHQIAESLLECSMHTSCIDFPALNGFSKAPTVSHFFQLLRLTRTLLVAKSNEDRIYGLLSLPTVDGRPKRHHPGLLHVNCRSLHTALQIYNRFVKSSLHSFKRS